MRSNKRVTQKSPGGGMVDAHVSGACVERHAGSSPVLGTVRMNNCGSSSVGRA